MVLRVMTHASEVWNKNSKFLNPHHSLWNRLTRKPLPGTSLKSLNEMIRPNMGR